MAKCSSSRRLVPLSEWADFIQRLLKKNEKKLNRSFNLTFRYIEDVLSLNNFMLGDFVDRIYPIELEIKDNTYTDRSASYLDILLEIDRERLVYCLWCLAPLSTLFQLYRGGQVYWCDGGIRSIRQKPPTWRKSLTNFATNGAGTHNLSGDRHWVHM